MALAARDLDHAMAMMMTAVSELRLLRHEGVPVRVIEDRCGITRSSVARDFAPISAAIKRLDSARITRSSAPTYGVRPANRP